MLNEETDHKTSLPRISVIMPSLNQADFIGEAIESVLGQEYQDIELIILDAGSTDSSVEIIRGYDSQIAHWHSQSGQ